MISRLGNLAKWEWFKLRQRRITWILLAMLMLFSAFAVWLRFADYEFTKDASVKGEVAFLLETPNVHNVEWDIDCAPFLAGQSPTLPPGFTMGDVDVPRTGEECRKELLVREDRLSKLETAVYSPRQHNSCAQMGPPFRHPSSGIFHGLGTWE